jgi:hypothetical protein
VRCIKTVSAGEKGAMWIDVRDDLYDWEEKRVRPILRREKEETDVSLRFKLVN